MAGPAAPSASASPSGSASASVAPKEMTFPLPPTTLQSVEKKLEAKAPASAHAAPTEHVLVPQRGTLAAGRFEAKPITIWLVVAAGALLVLSWALARVRRARLDARKKLDALTTLKKKPVG